MRDLWLTFTDKQVERIFLFSYNTSICVKHQDPRFKVLTRWYHTLAKLHRMFPQSSKLCWRCREDSGSLLHIFWSCCLLQSFWTLDQMVVQKETWYNEQSKVFRRSILPLRFTAAKRCIPLLWKKGQTPSIAVWLKKVAEINKEDLRAK